MKKAGFAVAGMMLAVVAAAQQAPRTTPATLSSSLGVFAFPANNQNAETQQKDEAACYSWATGNTGFDPLAAATATPNSAQQQQPHGTGLKGAAGGAATGALIGELSGGDAGKGAGAGAAAGAIKGRLAQKKAERRAHETQAQMQNQQSQRLTAFRRAFGACMEGKGYSVK